MSEQPEFLVLVTGLAGVPGSSLYNHIKELDKCQVLGQIHTTSKFFANDPNVIRIDAEDNQGFRQLFSEKKPDYVVDCSGNCALKACEYDPEQARLLNYSVGVLLAELCSQYNIPLIRLSSDLVWSGADPNHIYTEDDPCDPVTVYGHFMALAEEGIFKAKPNSIILRMPLPMAPSPNGHAGPIDWIESRFKKHRPATLYYDELRNALYSSELNQVICELVFNTKIPSGLYLSGGTRSLTLFQIGQIINVCGNYAPELLLGCMRHDAGPIPPRAGDVTTSSQKLHGFLKKTAIGPWPRDEWLVPDSRDWHYTFDRSKIGNINCISKFLF
jgi:dTDP-4-dehydrorhamnose reductase